MNTRIWWKYWWKALIAAGCMRFIPGIRMIGLNGSLATGKWRQESDIDFLIAVSSGRIFTVRALSLLCTQLLGLRRKGDSIAGKVCMNWYVTTEKLEIEPHDAYCARTYHNLIPLLDDGETYEHYRTANEWMQSFGFTPTKHQPVFVIGLGTRVMQTIIGLILGSWFERWVETRQTARVEADRPRLPLGSIVRVTNQELRFHPKKDHY